MAAFFEEEASGPREPTRARGCCWTLNNPVQSDIDGLLSLSEDDKVQYLGYGREIGESGTPHLQGYIYCRNPQFHKWFRERIPRAHVEFQRGTPEQAIEYCQKDGEYNEWGSRPASRKSKGETEKARWDDARAAACRGDLETVPSDIYVRYYRTLKEIKKDHMIKPLDADDCTGQWICGPAGCGKSRRAREENPNSYFKMANKWWDGYQDEDTVILDDLDKKHDVLGHHLKIWADRYSFIAEIKGGAVLIRPKKIIITSQYRIEDIWADEETRAALNRRYLVSEMWDAPTI